MKRDKLRLCHVSAGYYPFVGGAQTYLQAMSERFAHDGHAVTVLTTTATQVDCFWNPAAPQIAPGPAWLNGVRVEYCAVKHLPLAPWSFYLLRRLVPELSRLRWGAPRVLGYLAPWMPRVPDLGARLQELARGADIIHGVNIALEWPLIAAGRYARRQHVPFVATPFVHVGEPQVQRNYTMRHQLAALAQSDNVIVQTDLKKQALAALGLSAERMTCLGMGVNLDEVQGGDAVRFRAQHHIDGPVISYMGTLTYDKGVIHLCDAMRQLSQQGIEATLVLAGKPILAGGFETYYRHLSQQDQGRIRLLGQVERGAEAATCWPPLTCLLCRRASIHSALFTWRPGPVESRSLAPTRVECLR